MKNRLHTEFLNTSFPRRRESRSFFTILDSRLRGNDEKRCILKFIFIIIAVVATIQSAQAHHVLGRPSYSLGEDSNTPPSMQVETQVGKFYITYMAFPAFPKPNEKGRVNLYASRIDNGNPFVGDVTFKVKDDSWFSGWGNDGQEVLGVQKIDDGVYRQGFIFKEVGDYIVTAQFEADGEPYIIDFPLRIGEPFPIGPIGISVVIILLVIVGVNITQRKRIKRIKAQQHHEDK